MSDDLRERMAKALCENDGLSPSTIGYGSLWDGYLEAADAVLAVVEPDLTRLRRGMESAKAAHEAVWRLHQERGTRIFELQGECGRLRDDRDHWESIAGALESERNELAAKHATTVDLLRAEHERANAAIEREEAADEAATEIGQHARRVERERDEYRKAAEEADAKLRKIEHGCETPESHNYGCPCDEAIEFRGGSITLHPDPMTVDLRFDAGPWSSTAMFKEEADPAPVRQIGVHLDGQVWHEFLRAAATVDPGSRALREELAALREAYESKPAVMRLEGPGAEWLAEQVKEHDELRATIVSQAREIARLKGESA